MVGNSMRELSITELDLVAAGTGGQVEQILVIGTRLAYTTTSYGYLSDDGGFHVSRRPGDRSSIPMNTDYAVTNDDAPCADGVAVNAVDDIENLVANVGPYEFSGLIIKNGDGSFGLSQNEVSTLYDKGISAFDNIGNYSNAYGIVHNHPQNESDYLDNFQQRYPSDGDWSALDFLVSHGANPSNLSLYILDPFGDVREFHYSDKAMYKAMDDGDRAAGDNLPPPVHGCS